MRFAVSTNSGSWLLPSWIWRAAPFFLGMLLASVAGEAQTPAKQTKPPQQVKEDAKGAEKAADRGDQAAAAGRMEEALSEYDTAVRLAPGDIAIRRRAAGVRAQMVQKIVDQAESKALDGRVDDAVDLLYRALQ